MQIEFKPVERKITSRHGVDSRPLSERLRHAWGPAARVRRSFHEDRSSGTLGRGKEGLHASHDDGRLPHRRHAVVRSDPPRRRGSAGRIRHRRRQVYPSARRARSNCPVKMCGTRRSLAHERDNHPCPAAGCCAVFGLTRCTRTHRASASLAPGASCPHDRHN